LNIGQISNSCRPTGCSPKRINWATRLLGPMPAAAQLVTNRGPHSWQRCHCPLVTPITAAPHGLATLSPHVGAVEESSRTLFPPRACLPLPLLRCPLPTTWLTIEHHHYPPPSPSEWRIGSANISSSHSTQLQPELLASDAVSRCSPHRHQLPLSSPSTTMPCPPPGRMRVPQALPSSPATLRTDVLLQQPSFHAAVDHLATNRLPHHR
jgi:hypothetical protein